VCSIIAEKARMYFICGSMTYDDAIKRLKEYYDVVDRFLSFEAWMDTVLEHLDDIFGFTSTQSQNFRKLRIDYDISKIGLYNDSKLKINENSFRLRAKTQLHGILMFLEKKNSEAEAEQARKRIQDISNAVDKINKNPIKPPALEQPKPEPKPQQQPENKPPVKKQMELKDKKHYIIGISIFWTVAAIAANFFFWSGYYVGTIKYDKEKIDLSDENKKLTDDNNNLKQKIKDQTDTIRVLDFRLNQSKQLNNRLYQSLPERQRDSINNLNY
jgi:hypothetical protein